jgi:phosphatidylglycerophosphate synthase
MLALHLSSNYAWLAPVNITLIWLALLLTILSGIDYVVKAVRLSQMR